MKNLFFPGLFAALLIVSSCAEEPKEEVKDYEETTDTMTNEAKLSLGSIRVNIPSPLSLSSELSNAGYTYVADVLNPISKASSYSTNMQKAVNMGVYGADLGYVTVYNQSQDVLSYIGQITKLAADLGVAAAFDEKFAKGINNNLSNKDSVSFYFTEAFDKAEKNLRSDERVSTTAMIITGGWVEGLYIATRTIGDKPKDEKTAVLYDRVWDHVFAFSYVFKLLSEYKKNPDCAKLLEDLNDARKALTKFEAKGRLSTEDIQTLKEIIAPARAKLVG